MKQFNESGNMEQNEKEIRFFIENENNASSKANELNLQRFIHDKLLKKRGIHGIEHFMNVEAFGLMLARKTGAEVDVVKWFAYLHDYCRKTDGTDPDHGPKAAEYIQEIRNTYLSGLVDYQVEMLQIACKYHTILDHSTEDTIDTCFDADRLDLPRVGVILNPIRMATIFGYCYALNTYDCNLEQSKEFMRNL